MTTCIVERAPGAFIEEGCMKGDRIANIFWQQSCSCPGQCEQCLVLQHCFICSGVTIVAQSTA